LIKSKKFRVGRKKELMKRCGESSIVIVDTTKGPIERRPKKQLRRYNGKKKLHTIKSQILMQGNNQHSIL
jgi:hypothetical protein